MLYKEILTGEQLGLLPLIKLFSGGFGLVGGTAIALHLGHRQSIDFDLFSLKDFDNQKIRSKIVKFNKINKIIRDETGQFTLLIHEVRFTFFYYPYPIIFSQDLENIIRLPDLLTLAAMKAFALGRRAKWKDYVDLYFIARQHHGIGDICEKAKEIFGSEFNEKLFRSQLAYFNDINYSEDVTFMPRFEVDDEKIKKDLIEFSLDKWQNGEGADGAAVAQADRIKPGAFYQPRFFISGWYFVLGIKPNLTLFVGQIGWFLV